MRKLGKILVALMWLAMGLQAFALAAGDSPAPGGETQLEGGNNGPNPWQQESMPDDVAQQAKTQQEKAIYQSKYNECIKANPGDTAYCSCVADGGVKLNTNVPFVGRCINRDNSKGQGSTTSTAFSDLIGGLSKIVVTAILIVGFMFIIIGGVQWASGNPKEGKAKIMKVVIGLAILGASGAILRLINPNFFK